MFTMDDSYIIAKVLTDKAVAKPLRQWQQEHQAKINALLVKLRFQD